MDEKLQPGMRRVRYRNDIEPDTHKVIAGLPPARPNEEGWTWGHTSYSWSPRDLSGFQR